MKPISFDDWQVTPSNQCIPSLLKLKLSNYVYMLVHT